MSTNSYIDVYVRVTCPKPGRQSNPFNLGSSPIVGHYDLVVDDTISVNLRSVSDPAGTYRHMLTLDKPTFSWGTDDRLTISSLENAADRSNSNYIHYKWKFTVTQADIQNLIDSINSITENIFTGGDIPSGQYKIKPTIASGFSTYDIHNRNCFVAVSIWMEELGVIQLSDIVAGAQSKRLYTRVLDKQVGAFNGWTTA